MELNRDDLPYFVEFVILDEATRVPAPKRNIAPVKSFWLCYAGKHRLRGLRGDIPRRRRVCIEALRTIGKRSVDDAAAEVATALGRKTTVEVNRIRTAYYDQPPDKASWDLFCSQFLHWRQYILDSDEKTRSFLLNLYCAALGKDRSRRLAKLIEDLRKDDTQCSRNRQCLLEAGGTARARIESHHWNPLSQWQSLATDLWSLGRLHAGIGDRAEARDLLKRALEIWTTSGHELPSVQAKAIMTLQAEILPLI